MIKKNNQTIGAVYKGTTEISKILKGTTLLYENWQTLTSQGISPLTLTKCKGENLLGYKVYGQSIQEANLVDNDKIIASSISSGYIETSSTGLIVKDFYSTMAFLMSDLFEPNTTYYIHCERVYSTTRTNATGRISNLDFLGTLLDYNVTDGKFTTGDTVSGYLYLYGFASGTVEFNNLYIGKLPYTQYETHKVPSPSTPIEVQSVGDRTINIWDEQWELGRFDTTTGVDVPNSTQIRAKNLIPVLPNTVYYAKTPYALWTIPFDSSKQVLENAYMSSTRSGNSSTIVTQFTTPEDCYYIRFYCQTNYGTTYNNDICINVSNTSINGTYEPYGYKIPITTSGFNIWDEQWELGYWNSSGQKASASTAIRCVDKIPILEYTTYYIKCGNPNGLMVRFLDSNDTPLLSQYTTNAVITAPKNSVSMVFYTNTADNVTTYNNNICINISNTTLNGTYQSYTAPTTTNIYLDAPLRKVGTVSDYIDFENSKVVRIVKQGKIDNDSTFSQFGGVTDYSAFYLSQNDLVDYETGMSINQVVLSPTFKYYPCLGGNVNSYWTDDYEISSAITATYKRILFTLPNTITDTTQAKTWLQTNPIDFYYPTNSPTQTTITLSSIPSIKGITVYIVGTNIQPSNMWVKYKGK